ncbi:MAG: tetratricopeptide repeat-containing protein [Elainellaceae cyanobacterium]
MTQSQFRNADNALLANAWQLYTQIQGSGHSAFRRYLVLQATWMALSLGAILLALLSALNFPASSPLRVGTMALAIAAALIFARANQMRNRRLWGELQSAAEGLGRALYLYRTVLQRVPQRHHWLSDQLQRVQQQVDPTELSSAGAIASQPQYSDLLAEDYIAERIAPRIVQLSQQGCQQRRQQQVLGVVMALLGGLSVLLPVLATPFSLWAVLPLAVSLAVGHWFNVSELATRLGQAASQRLELTLLRDRWLGLMPNERTGSQFFRLVMATEALLADQPLHAPELEDQDAMLLQAATVTPSEPELERPEQPEETSVTVEVSFTEEAVEPELEPENEIVDAVPSGAPDAVVIEEHTMPSASRGAPHAFVVMPFGRKQGSDGNWIDFNRIYSDLIKPALLEAGFEPFRADEEASSGDILTDMFQELLLADLVIADLSIDNANVYYELGIRHAMRKRGIVHIQSGRAYMPFDIFNVRTIPYHCDDSGCPDPAFIKKDKQAIVSTLIATWESDRNAIHSPIFNLLDGLVEPDRKTLRTPLATGYWEEYTSLQQRLQVAQRQKRIGDVLLLTEEVKNPLVKEDVLAYAGRVLRDTGNSALALKQYRQGLDINPENVEFRCEEAYHLSRLQQANEAIVKLEALLEDKPNHTQAMSYLARIYKDLWKSKWFDLEEPETRVKAAYAAAHFLQKAIENYLRAFRLNQNSYYPGINAFMLTAVLDDLANRLGPTGDSDEVAYRAQMMDLKGAVEFCLRSQMHNHPKDFWAAASLGDLAVCTAAEPMQVAIAYKKALTALWNQKFALQSILDQLHLLDLLAFRPEYVEVGRAVLEEELQRFKSTEVGAEDTSADSAPVFMFSGHMVDNPARPKPRFPAAMESEAKRRIEEVLDRLGAEAGCRAICGGIACGGDTIFLEACLSRGMVIDVYLPFEQPEFIQDSVSFAGDRWVERFYAIANHPDVTIHLQPERLGAVPEGEDVYSRNNRWTLYNALTYRIDCMRLLVLWNGQGGDGPGGTNDMVQQVRQLGGIVEHIDTTKFDYWKARQTTSERESALENERRAEGQRVSKGEHESMVA